MILKEIELNEKMTHVALSGRLDIAGVQDVELKFTTAVASREVSAIIDVSDVSFLASLGMRMLLSVAKNLNNCGAVLVLLKPQVLVREALETAGFGAVMPIVETIPEAMEILQK